MLRFLILVALICTAAFPLPAQPMERPVVLQPELRLGPDTATDPKLAQFWSHAFEQLDPTKQVRIALVRGGYSWTLDLVVRVERRDSLLVVTTGLNKSGRRRVIVRADDVISMEESPSSR